MTVEFEAVGDRTACCILKLYVVCVCFWMIYQQGTKKVVNSPEANMFLLSVMCCTCDFVQACILIMLTLLIPIGIRKSH